MPLDKPDAEDIRRIIDEYRSTSAVAGNAYLTRVADNLAGILAREEAPAVMGFSAQSSEDRSAASGSTRTAGAHLIEQEKNRLQSLLSREGSARDLHRELCFRIRKGTMDWTNPALMAHLRLWVNDKLAIDNPRYRD